MKKNFFRNLFREDSVIRKQNLIYLFVCMSFLLLPAKSMAQERMIQGTVTDAATNEPLIGASIAVKGSTVGTVTNATGNFSLSVSSGATLVFSYVGYETQEIAVGNQQVLQVKLIEDTEKLAEVVVVGFGTQKKVNVTGAVGVAKAEDIQSRPVVNVAQALQGLVPGLEISKNSGSMEKSETIRIRGVGTISSDSKAEPLILIDGMEGDMNSINPQDIESVSVLKDAASSAIYGSRAPYGVILITTKSGKEGKTVVNYNNNFRWNAPVSTPNMLDSHSYAVFFNQSKKNSGKNTENDMVFTEETMQRMLDYQAGLISGPYLTPDPADGNRWGSIKDGIASTAYGNTDWYDILYKDWGFSQEHNVSASGGSKMMNYYFSLNYMDQAALLKVAEEGLKRYSVNGKIGMQLTKWAKLNYSSRFVRNDYTKPSALDDGLYENLARWTFGQPNISPYDNNGYLAGEAYYTPQALVERGRYNKVWDNNYQQVSLVLEPIKNWITTGDFNYRIFSEKVYSYNLPTYYHDINGNSWDPEFGSGVEESMKSENYMNGSLRSQYSFTLNEAHNFFFLAGVQIEDMKQRKNKVWNAGIINLDSPQVDGTTGLNGKGEEVERVAEGSAESWSSAGFFGRINYDYKGRYLFEMNMRYDGSSRYRQEKRWRYYPSFSLGWNLAQEGFMEPINHIVNTFKFRASWGSLGSQGTNNWYPTYQEMNLGANNGDWLQNGKKTNTAGYPAPVSYYLTWETVESWNAGIDLGFFKNRLTGSFDLYIRNTFDMLGPAQSLPATYGQSVPQVNNTTLKTKGFELELMWRDQLRNGFSYGVKGTLSDARSYIIDYPNATGDLGTDYGRRQDARSLYRSDMELGEIWGFETIGIAQSEEQMLQHLRDLDANYEAYHGVVLPDDERLMGQSSFGSVWGAGDIMYKDIDGNGRVNRGDETIHNHGDLKVIGNSTPRFLFGIDLNASWKGVDIRAFFQGVMKRDFWTNSSYLWGAGAGQTWSVGFEEHLDYFRDESSYSSQFFGVNKDSYFPRPSFDESGVTGRNRQVQTRYLQDASYIRLKNIQIGYTFPVEWTSKIGISQFRVYLSGENLWTGTKLRKMFDPETINGGSGSSSIDWRVKNNGNTYPLSKVISCGLSLTF